ncbi:hypothetical protein IEO21_03729 [Rhodonia placenta]|uniref:cAMP-independent regulatory protein pac2 n=1 Tax=Rhodonia placenta TaxID=104341 RepID=A0A8H7P542_9APHY|nr:hypothetical protein IEO21_03729 [Postia placenta]
MLPLITRRLTATEREQLDSGNVFVWEEAEHKQGGLERWTDGRRWSQSRMRGDYLFYEEKIETTPEEKAAKAARRARRTLDPLSYQPAPTRQDRPSKPDGLTKQTYSTHVYTSQSEPRKWHIVAYFSGDDYTHLPLIDDYDFLRSLRVPEGVFTSPRGNPTRVGRADSGHEQARGDLEPESSSSSSSSSTSVVTNSTGSTTSRHSSSGALPLPRLSNVVPIQYLGPSLSSHGSSHSPISPNGSSYVGLTSEDRRALNSFRVVL